MDETVLRFVLQDSTQDTPAPGSASEPTPQSSPVVGPGAAAASVASQSAPGPAETATAPPPAPQRVDSEQFADWMDGFQSVVDAIAGLELPAPDITIAPPPGPAPDTAETQGPIIVGGFGVAEQEVAPPGPAPPAPQPEEDEPEGPNYRQIGSLIGSAGTAVSQAATGNVGGLVGTAGTAIAALGGPAIVVGAALGAAAVAAYGLVAGVNAARSALEQIAADVAGFNAQVAQSQSLREIMRIERQVERGQAVGSELSDFIRAQARLEQSIGRATDRLIEATAPLLTDLIDITSTVVETVTPAVRGIVEGVVLVTPVLQIIDKLGDWLGSEAAEDQRGVDVFSLFMNLPDLTFPGFENGGVEIAGADLDIARLPVGVPLP